MEPTDDHYAEAHRAARDAARAARDTARAARHAARHARRAHRYEIGKRWHSTRTPWFFGSLLVGLGVLFLLHNLRLVNAGVVFRNMWPALILAWGLSRVIFGHPGEKLFGGIAAFFGAVWLGDRYFDWDVNIAGLFWPLLLIGLGLSMLFRPRRFPFEPWFPPSPTVPGGSFPPGASASGRSPAAPSFGDASPESGTTTAFDDARSGAGAQTSFGDDTVFDDGAATIREFAFMSGIERRNISQVFRGGALTSVMGAVELDLRDCRMASSSASVLVQVIMGQVSLRIPEGWTVESHVSAVLGNVEDRSDRPVESAPKRLIIEGSVFMGQVEIRN